MSRSAPVLHRTLYSHTQIPIQLIGDQLQELVAYAESHPNMGLLSSRLLTQINTEFQRQVQKEMRQISEYSMDSGLFNKRKGLRQQIADKEQTLAGAKLVREQKLQEYRERIANLDTQIRAEGDKQTANIGERIVESNKIEIDASIHQPTPEKIGWFMRFIRFVFCCFFSSTKQPNQAETIRIKQQTESEKEFKQSQTKHTTTVSALTAERERLRREKSAFSKNPIPVEDSKLKDLRDDLANHMATIQAQSEYHYHSLSKEMILAYIKLYDFFMQLQVELNTLPVALLVSPQLKKKKKSKEPEISLSDRMAFKIMVEKNIEILSSKARDFYYRVPGEDDFNAKGLIGNFNELSEVEKNAFRQGKASDVVNYKVLGLEVPVPPGTPSPQVTPDPSPSMRPSATPANTPHPPPGPRPSPARRGM